MEFVAFSISEIVFKNRHSAWTPNPTFSRILHKMPNGAQVRQCDVEINEQGHVEVNKPWHVEIDTSRRPPSLIGDLCCFQQPTWKRIGFGVCGSAGPFLTITQNGKELCTYSLIHIAPVDKNVHFPKNRKVSNFMLFRACEMFNPCEFSISITSTHGDAKCLTYLGRERPIFVAACCNEAICALYKPCARVNCLAALNSFSQPRTGWVLVLL